MTDSAASETKRCTAGLVSPVRQATHIVVGGSPALRTKHTPGRPWNVAADAGHRPMPCPAATCSHHSSTVRAVAPMIGTSPLGPGPDEPVVLPGPRLAAVRSQVGGNEWQSADVRQAELSACRERVPGRKHEHAWLRPHRRQLDPGGRDRRAQQRDVTAVVEQAGRRLSHVEDLQVHLDGRVRALEGGEQLGSGLVLGAGPDPYRKLAGDRAGSVAGGRYAAVQAGQRLPRDGEERGAGGRERGTLVRPVQQLGSRQRLPAAGSAC